MQRALAAIAWLLFSAAAPAGEGCNSLDGTYRNASDGKSKDGKDNAHLDDFVRMPRGGYDEKLVVFGPMGNRGAQKKHFASTATIAFDGKVLQLEYHDAAGKPIVRYPADYPYAWTCKGSQFEWEYEGVTGMGNDIRETRSRGVLARDASGDLLMVEEVHDSRKPAPSRTEQRFRAVPAPSAPASK